MTAGSVSVPIIIPLRPPVLGLPKSTIDTTTRIEMKSDTPNAKIYYTINGLKPEPFQNFGPHAKATFLYSQPFLLPAGKKTLKAVAISENHQESHIVTKVFDVDHIPIASADDEHDDDLEFLNHLPSNNEAKQKVKKFANKLMTSKEVWNDMKNNDQKKNVDNTPGKNFNRIQRFHKDLPPKNFEFSMAPMVSDSNQFVRLQRETDYLRCPHCLVPRSSSDPFSRFCNECGNPITPLVINKPPPPHLNQIGKCFNCQSIVPFNTNNCLICESPLKPQNVSRADVKLSELSLCLHCGTANQSNVRFCISCQSALPERIHSAPLVKHPQSFDTTLVKTCLRCGRNNNSTARFCDWCRSKIHDLPWIGDLEPLQCSKCCTTNQAHAHYCSNCGDILQAPKSKVEENLADYLGPPVKVSDVSTQTVGLFYPSQPKFKHQEIFNSIIKSRLKDEVDEGSWTERKPVLTSALSPGRGYWRKQIEHICAHLKAHASNDTNFRSLISQPRMGKLLQATVNEDGYELSLTLNFALRSTDNIVNINNFKNKQNHLHGDARRHRGGGDGDDYDDDDRKEDGGTKSSKTSKEKEGMSEANKNLLKEVGKLGRGRPEKVLELIDEGADPPSCINKDGLSVLHLAAINKHADVIPVLVQSGIKADVVEPSTHNTPLHEAVKNNSNGTLHVVETLLGCGANPAAKNTMGTSPYEMAVSRGYDELAAKMSVYIGQLNNTSKLSKPKKTNSFY